MDNYRTLLFQHSLLKVLLAFTLRLETTKNNKCFEFPERGNELLGRLRSPTAIYECADGFGSTSRAPIPIIGNTNYSGCCLLRVKLAQPIPGARSWLQDYIKELVALFTKTTLVYSFDHFFTSSPSTEVKDSI